MELQLNQTEGKSSNFFIIVNRLTCLIVVLSLDEGDYPENVQTVCLYHNK